MADRVKTIEELARAIGRDRTTVFRWRREWGLQELFDESKGGWDPDEVKTWAEDMKRTRRAVLSGSDMVLNPEDVTTSDGKNWANEFRKVKTILATLQLKRMNEQLVERSEVEQMFSTRISELVTSLESLAAQLAPRLAPMTRESEIQAELRRAFHQLREHFARD